MIINIAYIFVFFVEMLISYIFFNHIGDRKYNLITILLIGTVIFEFGAVINIFWIKNAYINASYSVLANFIFSVVCFRLKKLKAFFYSIMLIAVSTFLEIISVFIISSLTDLYIYDYQTNIIQYVIEVVFSKVIYFLFVMLFLRFYKKDSNKIKIPLSFYVFPITTSVTVICFWYISLNQYIEYRNQIILAVVSALLFLATVFIFFSFQSNAQRENKLLLLQQEQDKIKTDMIYYDILEQQNNNLRTYAHDAKNHLSAIKNLNTDPEIDAYVSEMLESLKEYSNVSHSGNRILDVIIDKYVTECRIKNINFEFDIKNNNLSSIEYYDTVTVLGNLLDNAIEATAKSQDKHITFETDYRNNFSVIIVSNSCEKNPISDNTQLPATTKGNTRLHGFGLRSVKKAVKKYNGDVAFDYDSKSKNFIVTVMIEN